MYTGKVIGSLVATVKDENLKGIKLMVVQVLENGKPGRTIIAADGIGVAGRGDIVYIIGSKEAAMPFPHLKMIPVDASIVGIVDEFNVCQEFKK